MAWTNVAKPAESSVILADSNAGQPFGLLIAITSVFTSTSSTTSGWGKVNKSTDSIWTGIAKPTASVGAWTNIVKPT